MRRIILAILFIFSVSPAFSDTPAKPERKQETVSLGNERFLIFVGEPNESGFAYTADLVVIAEGIPHFEPLFTQDYDVDTNKVNLSEGVAFQAESYNFDKTTNTLAYTTLDTEKHERFQYKYNFATDMFTIDEVIMQQDATCTNPPCGELSMPKVIYKAQK